MYTRRRFGWTHTGEGEGGGREGGREGGEEERGSSPVLLSRNGPRRDIT